MTRPPADDGASAVPGAAPPGVADEEWLECEQTRALLGRLDGVLEQAAAAEDLLLRVMALHLVSRGGKRLRPALLLLAASYGDCDRDRLLRAAAALELVHIASLYHDDVMDRAPTRRHVASANATWGNELAALTGTYLFARASGLLASLGNVPNHLASTAMLELCTGQLQEVEHAYDLDLTEEEHLEILARKTATLFELPCRLGARLGGLPERHAAALAAYGRHLGLAFQLTDDALDLPERGGQSGKATGTDVREGIYSLAVLYALRQEGPVAARLRVLLGEARLAEQDVAAVHGLVRESGAVAAALDVARTHTRQARGALRVLPEGPARRSLSRLADYVVTRAS